MTGRIDQVDEEAVSVVVVLDKRQVVISKLVVQRDGAARQRGQGQAGSRSLYLLPLLIKIKDQNYIQPKEFPN